MKALVYHGPGHCALEERPKPQIQAPTDTIIGISKTKICGTDLHIQPLGHAHQGQCAESEPRHVPNEVLSGSTVMKQRGKELFDSLFSG